MATDVARLALQIDVTGAQRAKQALAGLQDGSIRATRATNQLVSSTTRLSNVTRGAGSNFRFMRGSVQQVGYQVGDFAVQVGSGQSALIAFSQQASQLAGIMGPGGAVIGAVIAIGGAIAGGLVRSFSQGEESTKDLAEQMRKLAKELGYVSDRQRDIINTGYAQTIAEQTRKIEEQRAAIYDANRNAETFYRNQLRAGVPASVIESSEAWKNLISPVEDAKDAISGYQQVIAATEKERKEFWKNLGKTGDTAEDTAEKIREMVSSAQEQAATIGLSARAIATYEAALAGANAEQILAIDRAYQRIEAEQAEQKAVKQTAKAEAEALKQRQQQEQALASMREQADPAFAEFNRYANQIDQIEQFNITAAEKERLREVAFAQHQQRMAEIAGSGGQNIAQANMQGLQMLTNQQQTALGAIGQIFGNMAQIAEKGGKEQFDTWKALASAQAAVSTALAISNALATPPAPVGIALAGTIGALGAVQIAQIQQTEYQGSYLGGGYTGTGSRTGGVDGQGGFPAILHPNETVIDHERAGAPSNSSSVNQTIVMNVSGDVTARTRQEILKAIPMIRQQARQSVLQASQEGGAMSRAMGRR